LIVAAVKKWLESLPAAARPLKFLVVGGTNTVLMYLLYLGLLLAGMSYPLALSLDYVFGILLGYTFNRHFTFGDRSKVKHGFKKYCFTYVLVFAGNLLLLALIVESGRLDAAVGQIIAFGSITLLSYLLQNHWVFRDKR
jgi:putative flippase GtrA